MESELSPEPDPEEAEAPEGAGGANEMASPQVPDQAPEPEAVEVETATEPELEVVSEDAVLGDTEVSDTEDDDEAPAAPRESPYDRPGRWYVIHSYAGYENKVNADLQNRIQAMGMEERIYEVVIPMEEVVEFKGGKKQVVQKKMFPGYLLVRCELDDDAWYVIRNTPGVTGFVGPGTKPTPLGRRDVENFLQVPADDEEAPRKPRAAVGFNVGDPVRVLTGPFADFTGMVAEVKADQQKVKVLVDIFGRETPVELGFDDIQKL